MYKVVLIGDIKKAFLQMEVDPSDRGSLRFFWVEDITAEKPKIKEYRFCCVLSGAGPSPFLLNGTLRHHLSKYEEVDPMFVQALKDSLYVDDLLGASSDEDQAHDLYQNTKKCLKEGGFEMHKWKSNCGELMKCIEQGEENSKVFDSKEVKLCKETVDNLSEREKILGIVWNRHKDTLHFDLKGIVSKAEGLIVTKRNVLRVLSSIFDPLGLISPITVTAKSLLQEVRETKSGWNDELNEELKHKWFNWIEGLKNVAEITFSRSLFGYAEEEVLDCELHGFADSSKKAYCAALYLRYTQPSGVYTSLVTSKTRVSPLKRLLIPLPGADGSLDFGYFE